MPNKDKSVILLIDDEEMLLQLSQQFLEMAGLQTKGFVNSQLALEWFKENSEKVAISILDLKMSGLDGKSCFEQMLKADPSAKVAFLTGLAEPEVENELMDKGAIGFLKKPLRYPDLVEWVRARL
jgi:FixJ family two-component response regulator